MSGQGVKELLYHVQELLSQVNDAPVIYEQEFYPEMMMFKEEAYTVEYDEEEQMYVVEGPKIEKMLGYTNIIPKKAFSFSRNSFANRAYLSGWKNWASLRVTPFVCMDYSLIITNRKGIIWL